MSIKDAINIANSLGIMPVAVLFLVGIVIWLIRVIFDEDKSSIWRARVNLALFKLSGRREAEKEYIANDVRGRINIARRKLHAGKSNLPKAVSVHWVEEGGPSSYHIKEGEFVVKLNQSNEQEKNIVDLTLAVIRRSTLLGVRSVIDKPLSLGMDLCLARNILQILNHKAALDWFLANELKPLCDADERVARECERISEIDDRGLFTRLLLVELEEFADRIIGKQPRPYMLGEIEGLVDFLYNIATKKYRQDVPLQYTKALIRIGVILVARTSRILQKGVDPYVNVMAARSRQRQLYTYYVMSYDKEVLAESDPAAYENFKMLVQDLDEEIARKTSARKDFSLKYTCVDQFGRMRRAICTRYVVSTPEELN